MNLMLAIQKVPYAAIVEDERDLARMYEMILAKMGIAISFVAHSGRDAIVRFEECTPKPQIVLMDNRLPSMSGVEATKAILEMKPDTRIIFLTADTGAREEAIKAGAALFICKPARISEIMGAIESARDRTLLAGTVSQPGANEAMGSW